MRKKTKKGDIISLRLRSSFLDVTIAYKKKYLHLYQYLKIEHMSKGEKIINWIVTILTALTVMAQYILQHIPKTGIILLLFSYNLASGQSLKVYPIKKALVSSNTVEKRHVVTNHVSSNIDILQLDTIYCKDSTIWFSPSAGIQLFSRELKTNVNTFGVLPGLGYGIKYNPYKYKSGYLLALDVFIQAGYQIADGETYNKVYSLQIVPVASFYTYFHAGYGYRWHFNKSGNTSILVFGFSLPFN